MPLDSVSITLTSLSGYHSTNHINYLSALALLPILLFLCIIFFRSVCLWHQPVFMPLQGQKIDCLTDGTERGKQTKSSLVIEKEEGKSEIRTKQIINYMRNSRQTFPLSATLLFWPYLCGAMKGFPRAFAMCFPCCYGAEVLLSHPTASTLEQRGKGTL